jgi:hypothetical protein
MFWNRIAAVDFVLAFVKETRSELEVFSALKVESFGLQHTSTFKRISDCGLRFRSLTSAKLGCVFDM